MSLCFFKKRLWKTVYKRICKMLDKNFSNDEKNDIKYYLQLCDAKYLYTIDGNDRIIFDCEKTNGSKLSRGDISISMCEHSCLQYKVCVKYLAAKNVEEKLNSILVG